MIKAYTDLEQSKKLTEILPIESADMVLLHEEPYETSDSKFDGLHQALCVPFKNYDKSWRQKYRNISYFPCWSLAALLGILPTLIGNFFEKNALRLRIDKGENDFNIWYENFDYENFDYGTVAEGLDVIEDNPVDACYKMILDLHEQKLL